MRLWTQLDGQGPWPPELKVADVQVPSTQTFLNKIEPPQRAILAWILRGYILVSGHQEPQVDEDYDDYYANVSSILPTNFKRHTASDRALVDSIWTSLTQNSSTVLEYSARIEQLCMKFAALSPSVQKTIDDCERTSV